MTSPWQAATPSAKNSVSTKMAPEEEEQQQQPPEIPHIWRRTRSLDDGPTQGRRRKKSSSTSRSPKEKVGELPQQQQEEEEDEEVMDDNGNARLKEQDNDDDEEDDFSQNQYHQNQPLHSSFDAALLQQSDLQSIFRSVHHSKTRRITATAGSLLNHSNSNSTPHSSGRKHLRQPRVSSSFQDEEGEEEEEMVCPRTVRKLARHNSNGESSYKSNISSSNHTKETPVRTFQPYWNTSSTTNSSSNTATRNQHHHHHPRTVWKAPRGASSAAAAAAAFSQQQPPLTPTAPCSTATTQPSTTQQQQQQRRFSESTTATLDTDSPSITPFRFTTFPASLPRVHPPLRDNHSHSHHHHHHHHYESTGHHAPDTIRKRMFFPAHTSTNARGGTASSSSDPNNQSREEETGTQNTSISSLSTHGGLFMCDEDEDDDDADEDQPRMTAAAAPPVHTRLFLEEEAEEEHLHGDDYAYSEDEEEEEEEHDNVDGGNNNTHNNNNNKDKMIGRTRLNFNFAAAATTAASMHSPKNLRPSKSTLQEGGPLVDLAKRKGMLQMRRMDESNDTTEADDAAAEADLLLSRPYEPKHVHSFPSIATSSTAGLTASGEPLHHNTPIDDDDEDDDEEDVEEEEEDDDGQHLHQEGPATPREVQLHFQLDNEDQCSPIPGIPEEEELRSRPVLRITKPRSSRLPPKPYYPSSEDNKKDANNHNRNPPHIKPSSSSSFAPKEAAGMTTNSSNSNSNNNADRHSFSAAESVSSSTSSAKMRRRPMPDMAAFEADAASKNAADRSADDLSGGGGGGGEAGSGQHHQHQAQTPKLRCPPTPVRTPVWAHVREDDRYDDTYNGGTGGGGGGGNASSMFHFHRSRSLIMTRILATCADAAPGEAKVEATIGDQDMADKDDNNGKLQASVTQPGNSEQAQSTDSHALPGGGEVGSFISFSTDFESLGILGRGQFADVWKVRSRMDNRLYAVKRNRRHFRGKRDRDIALSEVRFMQHLQQNTSEQQRQNSYLQYLLFFYRAWQEDGHFFCQTELCCRDTCRELMDSLRSQWNVAKTRYPSLLRNLPSPDGVVPGGAFDTAGRLVPEISVWKICHDICAGLSHIHSRGLVHNDIKPSNIFFVAHPALGCLSKIGDFGLCSNLGASDDGQEGDQQYMAPELLSSGVKQSSSDIFSLGLTLYELASDLAFELPKEGPRWHELRHGAHFPELPASRDVALGQVIQLMISPAQEKRPSAQSLLNREKTQLAGNNCDTFLRDYIADLEEFDAFCQAAADRMAEDQTPRNGVSGAPCRVAGVCSPTFGLPSTRATTFTPNNVN